MRNYIRQHHLALIALFFALSGTAAAVDGPLPGQNQVGSGDIIDNEVKSSDIGTGQVKNADVAAQTIKSGTIGNGSVQGIDILNETLTNDDIGPDAVRGSEIADGQVGTADQAVIPAARVGRTSTQSIPDNGLFNAVNFDSESDAHHFDTANLHDTATNNDRLTAPVSGLYFIQGQVRWSNDPDNDEVAQNIAIFSSDTLIARSSLLGADATVDPVGHEVSTVAKLNAGEFVNLRAAQRNADSDSLNFACSCATEPSFEMTWLGPAP
jgi:hypothetical protein